MSIKAPHLPAFAPPRIPVFWRPRRLGLKLTNPLTARIHWSVWLTWLAIALYLLICALLLWACIIPAHNGESQIRLGADSATYWGIAQALDTGSNVALLSFSGNLLGPVALALILKSVVGVALFNLALFLLSIWVARSVPEINYCVFVIVLMLNAETAVSIVSLNKEIFSLISLVLLVKYVYSEKRSKLLLVVILGISLLARWEQSFIILIYLLLRKGWFREHPWFSIFFIVGGMSLLYPFMLHSSRVDLSGFSDQAEGGGLIVLLNSIQNRFGFFLVLVPKIVMSVAGRLLTPWYFLGDYWNLESFDLQNRFAVHLHEIAIVAIFAWVLLRKRFSIGDPIPFFIVLYLVITSINPFIQPRYQYPTYVLLCLHLASSASHRQKSRSSQPVPLLSD